MSEDSRPKGRSRSAILFEFLGSMNLAITLLVAIAIASVIGTVLQQNQPYTNYIFKFGPFWFEVFKALGLYDIYGSPWFILLLGFLLVSTSVCVWRHTPAMVRDMRQFRLDVQEKSLRAFHLRQEWEAAAPPDEVAGKAERVLSLQGYRVRRKGEGSQLTLAAMKGASSRLGYLLSHIAIVVICIGGLIDGNLPLQLAEWSGKLKVETRDLPVSEVPPASVLGVDNSSFRGSVTIPEGQQADFVFLGVRDGYLVQRLPFKVALDDFRIEHYASGQPKSFESDIVILDDELDEPLRRTIRVNHPLVYKGYAIYQASFSDGGSRLTMKAWSLDAPELAPVPVDGVVNGRVQMVTPRGARTIEVGDFKLYNIFPVEEGGATRHHNYGPSVTFKVRDEGGQALEYVNYMVPVTLDGRVFYLSGVRTSPSEDFRYIHFPLDAKGGLERFMRLRTLALDERKVRAAALAQVGSNLGEASAQAESIANSIARLVRMFSTEGIEAVVRQAEQSVAPEKQTEALESYIQVIQSVLGALYIEVLVEEGRQPEQGVDGQDATFFDDALNAISLLGPYGSPFYLQLTDYDHVEASGLQITRSPGKDVVYLGCVMLMAGIFFMFYMHHRRVWVKVAPGGEGAAVLVAGTGHRDRQDFSEEFAKICSGLRSVTNSKSSTGD